MQIPTHIVFRDMPHSDAIEAAIRDKVAKLDQFYERIMSCRVTVGMICKHKRHGRLHNVRVDLTVPGSEIVVNRDNAEDVYVAIRDAFDHARRRLEDYARRQRGDVKAHEPESRGRIVRLFGDEGYGFIEDMGGTELYFHRYNVVHPDFEALEVGDDVVFLEETAGDGLQANRVRVHSHSSH
ncbi:HPF/RaiA family ribosome-associated protein [Aromatoleum bremense]|uniref:30S ribosomal protein S30 n=1 Tax=Aromatoleum bremense TaxID=76115 RepID=A0ABX1NQJ7_9RHOO|nr:HPF/RaiA family ribosome-associated protein [Aromatoleum bremense]NMG14168.1 30S ribosomal protein S30 [Aromatoleum bremense]QTQ33948.1 Cold shock-like protein [Aromatoleum bremense]